MISTCSADLYCLIISSLWTSQEAESKARKQFKGLFDKKPGEITEVGSEIREESKTIEEIDETKDNDEIEEEEEEEERTRTVVSTERKRKWSEKAWPIMKNVIVQIGIQVGVALLGVLIFQYASSRFT